MIRVLRNTLLFICSLLTAPLCAALKAVRGKNDVHASQVVVAVPSEQLTLDDIMGYNPSDPADRMSRKRHHVALKRALHELYPSNLSASEKELQLKAILDYTLNTANELVHRGMYGKKKASQAVSNLFTAARTQVTKTFDASDTTCTKALSFLKALQSHTSNRVLHIASKKTRRFWATVTAGGLSIASFLGWLWWRHKHPNSKPSSSSPAPLTVTTPLATEAAATSTTTEPTITSSAASTTDAVTDEHPSDNKRQLVLVAPPLSPQAEVGVMPANQSSASSACVSTTVVARQATQSRQQLSVLSVVQAAVQAGKPIVLLTATSALEAERISPGLLTALTSGWLVMQAAGRNLPSAGTALATVVGARALYQHGTRMRQAVFPSPTELTESGSRAPRMAAALHSGAVVLAVTSAAVTAYYYRPEALGDALSSGAEFLQSHSGQAALVLTSLAVESFAQVRSVAQQVWNNVPDMPWWLGGRGGAEV